MGCGPTLRTLLEYPLHGTLEQLGAIAQPSLMRIFSRWDSIVCMLRCSCSAIKRVLLPCPMSWKICTKLRLRNGTELLQSAVQWLHEKGP